MSELREIKSAVYPLALKVHQIDDKVSELKKEVDSQLSSITDQVDDMKQDIVDMQKNIDSKLAEAIAKITDEIKKGLESITGITATKSDDIKTAINSKLANTASAIDGLKKDIDSNLAATVSKIDEMKKDIDPKFADTVSKINGVTDGMKAEINSKLINVTSKVDKMDSELAKLGAMSDTTNKSISLLEALDVKGPRMGNFFCHWDLGDLHHVFEIKLFDDRNPEAVNWFRRLNFSSLQYKPVGYGGRSGGESFEIRIDFNGVAGNDWFRHFDVDSNEGQRRKNAHNSFNDVDNLVIITKSRDSGLLFFKITQSLRPADGDWDNAVIGRVVNYDKATLYKDGVIAGTQNAPFVYSTKVSKDRPFEWY